MSNAELTVSTNQRTASCCRLAALRVPLGILLLSSLAILTLILVDLPFEKQWSNMIGIIVVLVSTMMLSFWAIFYSGLPRFRTGIVIVAFGALVISVLEVDYDGNLTPSFRARGWVSRLVGMSHDDDLARHRQWQRDNLPAVAVDLTPRDTDSPGYRGADRSGVVKNCTIATDWNAHPPRELWKQPVGEGYGSFAVVNDFLFTIEQRRDLKAGQDEEAVVCYHAGTGRELWVHTWPGKFDETLGGPGPRTTPTVIDGEVYALGAKGRLVCLDGLTGQAKWGVETLAGKKNLHWGMSGSPLIVGDVVVVNPGPPGALQAYNRKTGELVWAEGNNQAGYASPMLAKLAGVEQILLFDGRGIAGCNPQTGKEFWRFGWKTQGDEGINVAQPIVFEKDRVFIASAYGRGGAMLQIQKNGTDWSVEQLWDTGRNAMRCKISSPVSYQGAIYGFDDGQLQCIDAETGSVRWTDSRKPAKENGAYDHGQLLLCGEHLVVLTQYGEVALVQATPDRFQELGRRPFLKGNKTWNNPALAGGILYIRNHVEMAAVDLRGK